MRNAVRISFLTIVLLLGMVPATHAWCYEAGSGTVCQGDFQQTSKNIPVFKNEYGVFGYNFVPEHGIYQSGLHWYQIDWYGMELVRYNPDCSRVPLFYRQTGGESVDMIKDRMYTMAKNGYIFELSDYFACHNVFSTQGKDLLLAEAIENFAIVFARDIDKSEENSVKSVERGIELKQNNTIFRERAGKLLKIVEGLRGQYFGTPGGL